MVVFFLGGMKSRMEKHFFADVWKWETDHNNVDGDDDPFCIETADADFKILV